MKKRHTCIRQFVKIISLLKGAVKKNCINSHKKERGEEAAMHRTVRGPPQTSSPASSPEKLQGSVVVFIAERGKKALLDVAL